MIKPKQKAKTRQSPSASFELIIIWFNTEKMVKYEAMISFVVPCYNEEESLPNFYKELSAVAPSLSKNYEIVFVDDGSKDSTLKLLLNLEKKDKRIRVYSFQKNQGKAEALTLGFHKAKGEWIITLDADLQDKPSEVKKLIKKSKEGWDMVAGWRKDRKDSTAKKIFSRIFNFAVSFFWGFKFNDMNGGLKLYRANAAKTLRLYGGMHRFIPLLLHDSGFKVTEVPIAHDIRRHGKSKYSASKVIKEMPDMGTILFLSKFSKRPLHFFGFTGGILSFIGLIILIYLSIIWFQGESIGRRPLLFLGMLLVISGFQVLFTGFLADLILSLNSKSNGSPNILLKYSSDARS